MALPALREEIDLMPGSALADGQPSWMLHDPARNLFFRIDWPTFEVMQRWWMDDPKAIAADISQNTALQLSEPDVLGVVEFLQRHQILQPDAAQGSSRMAERAQAMQASWHKWLLHHYLFFRVPLIRPDAWLGRWAGVASIFYARSFAWLTLLALGWGLSNVIRQWDAFAAQRSTCSAGRACLPMAWRCLWSSCCMSWATLLLPSVSVAGSPPWGSHFW